ncbi:probable feruloyl esterase A [Selaginella moellendorffii]|nr:probable feruloyl esterase A [Selaginella moellendorffii]|eukprot:XP_002970314.2 probable feruloyl esterase A [Selaginella moellendorffii]
MDLTRRERAICEFAFLACFFLCSAAASSTADVVLRSGADNSQKFNLTLAKIMVEYASAVYVDDPAELWQWSCDRCNSRTKGFELVDLIIDVKHCLQAFVGLDRNLGAIVMAFRGTQESSVQNWVEDLYFRQLDFHYPGCVDAMVHHGFYSAYHNTTLRPRVLAAAHALVGQHKDLKLMITGHSMGGAMATFAALDLVVNHKLENVHVVTFGQPRVGNPAFADYYRAMVPDTIRMTHAHDLVPHLPPYYPFFGERTYHHFATEVWIYSCEMDILTYDVFRVCDDSGEDPTCCRSVVGNSVSDHLMYLGVFLKAEPFLQRQSS